MSRAGKLRALLERVREAKEPSHDLNVSIACALDYWDIQYVRPWLGPGLVKKRLARSVSNSVDAAVAMIGDLLPGWCWRIGTCHISDDAWVAPDHNDPGHRDRLLAEFGPWEFGSEFDHGFDVARCPPGNLPLANLESLLMALIAIEERKDAAR